MATQMQTSTAMIEPHDVFINHLSCLVAGHVLSSRRKKIRFC